MNAVPAMWHPKLTSTTKRNAIWPVALRTRRETLESIDTLEENMLWFHNIAGESDSGMESSCNFRRNIKRSKCSSRYSIYACDAERKQHGPAETL